MLQRRWGAEPSLHPGLLGGRPSRLSEVDGEGKGVSAHSAVPTSPSLYRASLDRAHLPLLWTPSSLGEAEWAMGK